MLNPIKRYVIQYPDGSYSGANRQAVSFEKAKQWTNIGHVKNHIHSSSRRYPFGSVVLEISLQPNVDVTFPISDFYEEAKTKAALREQESKKRQIEAAERALTDAQERVNRLKGR